MSFIRAKLVSKNKIDVFLFTDCKMERLSFNFFKDGILQAPLKILNQIYKGDHILYELESNEDIELGHDYSICLNEYQPTFLDVSEAIYFPDFDELFFYNGDDLGANYFKDKTDFAVWAPLASKVILKIENNNNGFDFLPMKRTKNGVYRVSVQGNLINKKYHYLVTNSGIEKESNDPYGKGVSLNSEYSAVVDFNSIINKNRFNPLNKINNNVDAIIYETNVRDFTEDCSSIDQKGKYLGFVEEGKTTQKGNPAGIDYLKFLGITHVQLNPVLDFDNVLDNDVSSSYNWGYDPLSMFALEGNYSSNPKNPSSRLDEFSTMIEKLHENDIRVILDVVYNHTFKYENSCYEKIVPGYFFRRDKNNQMANASGCGNDIASERPMVRKTIVDSAKYLTTVFNIDGFRFDLMGLLDIDTINAICYECKQIKKDLIFYGEGWNMGDELPFNKKACSENHDLMPNVGFFNDTYRDVIKGPNSRERIHEKGYINGDIMYEFGMDYIFFSGVKDISYKPRFSDANQSIIYAECHDNNTIFDKLKKSNPDEDVNTLLKRICLANSIICLSYGVPFFHSGQEIGMSKNGNDNTYNIPKINNLDWKLVDERFDMVIHLKKMIKFRKSLAYTKLHSLNDIDNSFKIEHWSNGMYCLKTTSETFSKPYKSIEILINALNKEQKICINDELKLILSINNSTNNQCGSIDVLPISLNVLVK